MVDNRRRIQEVYKASTDAIAAGNLEALSHYYTDDAVQLPPDAPPLVGWSQIEASLERELDGITLSSTIDVIEIVIRGDLAYAWGHYRGIVTPKDGDPSTRTSGSFLDVLRREAHGSWQIARSTWSNHAIEKVRR